jgi:predicted phosphodiesterase
MQKLRSFLTKPSQPSFQIISDLHLEVGQQYSTFSIPPSAPYLVLAGDIGCLIDYGPSLSFLAKHITAFKKIFLVLGNHEFYNLSYTAGLELARKLEQEPVLKGKLVLFHRRRFDFEDEDVTVLGCTLWSRIEEGAKEVVKMRVRDFQKIEGWCVDEHNKAFEAESEWLAGQIAEVRGGKERNVLVGTHHAPCLEGTARPEQVENAWSSAFATDLLAEDDREQWDSVKFWVFGHTHLSTSFERADVRVVSNQGGYVLPGSKKDGKSGFDVRKVVRV